jgi:formylglycine-generating enzyme required for sulfatase activity
MGAADLVRSRPVHVVKIRAFEMAKTAVTNKQYRACVGAGACTPSRDCGTATNGDDSPVICVTWAQAEAFSRWAGGTLPSEAQWEYAARSAGKNRRYPWGDADPTCATAVIGDCAPATLPVCSAPNGDTEQGLCDMAGNVWEWTADWYHEGYAGAPLDGSPWESPVGDRRVMRGGASDHPAGFARSAFRDFFPPGDGFDLLGFRPVRLSWY